LIPWAYDEKDRSWAKFAELTPLCSQCARKDDQVSKSIIDNTANHILISISAVAKGLGFDTDSTFPLVLAGGNLIHDSSLLAEAVTTKVKAKYPNCQPTLPVVDVAAAGALLVIHRLGEK